MTSPDTGPLIDQMTMEVERLRASLKAAREGAAVPAAEQDARIDALLRLHHELRSRLSASIDTGAGECEAEGAPVEEAPAVELESRMDALRREMDRAEARLASMQRKHKADIARLSRDLGGRLERLEQGHAALLNGRIFSALRSLANLARAVRLLPRAAPVAPVPVAPLPATRVVDLDPKQLPPPARVPIAGVAYMSRPAGERHAPAIVHEGTPLISVVMTAFNTGVLIEEAVRSILEQSWKNLELIVVDDCSTDDTRERLERMARRDSRLQVLCFGENRGTYWCKNFGITRARGVAITFMDSDDTSAPTRLEDQFRALNVTGRVVTTCNHVRKDPQGNTIAINGIVERVAYISQMIKREVIDEIGYFDSVRTSADDEFLRRIRRTYGRDAHFNVKKVLYTALLREGSLTSDPDNAINFVQERNASQSFLSPQRKHYAAMCERWHEHLAEQNLLPFMPFPVVRRPFPAYGKLVIAEGRYDHNHITACLASYPPRREKLERVIHALLPQVDEIHVFLNEYEEVPDFLNHSRITVELGGPGRNLRDNGKFFFAGQVRDGYCFTVDDDIVYPPDYVQHLIRKIEFYDRGVIVGLHGTIYGKPVRSFFKGRTLYHFEEALEQDVVVNQLGTGTVAFHTSLVRPPLEWFETTGMADVWLAAQARRHGIPLVAIERAASWLCPMGVEETTLFREFRKDDSLQTRIIRQYGPWKESLQGRLAARVEARRKALGAPYVALLPLENAVRAEEA